MSAFKQEVAEAIVEEAGFPKAFYEKEFYQAVNNGQPRRALEMIAELWREQQKEVEALTKAVAELQSSSTKKATATTAKSKAVAQNESQ